jgi:GT2 family glycosyltransferase
MKITILILFHNKVIQTIECIESFVNLDCKILVLNNNSDAEQVSTLLEKIEHYGNVVIIESSVNLGVSKGRNRLIAESSTDWLFFVDNDIKISDTAPLVELLENDDISKGIPRIICPRIYNVHDSDYAANCRVEIIDNEVKLLYGSWDTGNCFPGGASIVHRSIFKQIGLYDENMFVGFEDYEFAIRAINMGLELKTSNSDRILLIHDHRAAEDNADSKAVRIRYDMAELEKSYKYLNNKFGYTFNHEWRDWSKQQTKVMLKPNLLKRLLEYLRS